MTATASGKSVLRGKGGHHIGVSGFTFFLFMLYQLDFFLHISGRIPGAGVLRPTLVMFAFIAFLLVLQREKIKWRLDQPIFKVFSAFLIMIFLTLPFVKFPGSVIRENFVIFLKAIVFMYFAALILDSEKRLKISLVVFVGCQVLRVLEPLFLNVTQGYWGDATYLGGAEFANRLAGAPHDVINPNELGFVIVTAIPFLHYFLMPRGGVVKLAYFAILALLLYALILTMSRGAFLALLVVAWFVWKESKHKILLIFAGVFIALTAWAVMDDNQRDRYTSLVSSDAKQSATAEGRLTGMVNEFKLGLERPIFGFGLGTTAEAKFNTFGKSKASHNMYAEVLIETGVVGLIMFLRFVLSIRRQLNSCLENQKKLSEFFKALFKILKIVFWMFVVYSVNYWGLSQYYWYNLAGLVVAASLLINANINMEDKV